MVSRTPTIKQVSLLGSFPHVAVLNSAIVVGLLVFPRYGPLLGIAVFLATRLALREVPQAHRVGITMVRQNRFADAIPYFQRSLSFFDRYPWLDDYRSILLLSPSAASYREMALANMGFCYSQIGDGANARKQYRLCLERYPNSGLARTALNMMDSVSSPNVSEQTHALEPADGLDSNGKSSPPAQ